MMHFWAQLLNGFCNQSQLLSLPCLQRVQGRLRLARDRLVLSGGGQWSLGFQTGATPVLLLRYVSIWTSQLAVLRLELPDGRKVTRWFMRPEDDSGWRRMRVRFRHV